MDIQRNSFGSRISSHYNNNDRTSQRSSALSLERMSDTRRSSLSNRVSLIDAMDLQTSNHYHQKDDLMQEGNSKRFSDFRRSSNKQREPYSFTVDIEEKDLNRNSNYRIKHQCTCSIQVCQQNHCICYLSPREICVIGQCCPKCIALKNQYLQKTRGFQLQKDKKNKDGEDEENQILNLIKQKNCKNMHYFKQVYANQPCMKDLIFCTCKKSHCQKKYCLCFEKGQKCGQFCVCIECYNKQIDDQDYFRHQQQRRWQRYAIYKPYDENEEKQQNQIDPDIQQFLQDNQQAEGQFNETMQFQPVNFENLLSNMYS